MDDHKVLLLLAKLGEIDIASNRDRRLFIEALGITEVQFRRITSMLQTEVDEGMPETLELLLDVLGET